jgi:hypothetical protein
LESPHASQRRSSNDFLPASCLRFCSPILMSLWADMSNSLKLRSQSRWIWHIFSSQRLCLIMMISR